MFGKPIRLFSLLGFEVRIQLSWLIIALLIVWTLARSVFPLQYPDLPPMTYWWMGIGGALIFFLSIILHEFAHSIVARKYGIPIKGITLFVFGGIAEMEEEPPSPRAEFLMAIAGPLTSVALAVCFLLLQRVGTTLDWPLPVTGVFHYLALINGVLAIFNMIPAFPLDGGRVLRAFLWKKKGSVRKATRTCARIGSGFGVVMIVLGLMNILFGNLVGGIWWALIGMFIRGASQMSFQQLEIRKALEGEPVRRFMRTDPVTSPPSISVQELVDDYIYRHHFKMLPVTESSKLLGCVRTREVKQIPREEWGRHKVEELIVPCSDQNTVTPDTDAIKALTLMQKTGNSRLLVVEREGCLEGVVTLKDLLRFLSLKLDLEGDSSVELSEVAD